jgi:CubicO group peptidase (beta-lactamase class C family)
MRRTTVFPFAVIVVVVVVAIIAGPVSVRAADPPPPNAAGFAPDRLARLDAYLVDLLATKRYTALNVLLARDGQVVYSRTLGLRDPSRGVNLQTDDIFAIASLTKLVTTTAALILVEEGKLTLNEPIAAHLPAFKDMKVLAGGTADAPVLVDATRPITLHHLLTHTAGLYASSGAAGHPVLAELSNRQQANPAQTLAEMADRLARLPLQGQPGEAWVYGPATDLVGALVERASGKPFDQFVDERILTPLKMRDTSFEVPESKRPRQVFMDARQPDGTLKSEPPRSRAGPWPSGGGGLFSTTADYLRFARMLLNHGELDGARILGPKTIDLMTRDHLHGLPKPTKIYPVSDGFGYGVEIRTDVARSGWLGTQGTYGWNGATTCYCSIDPREGIIAMVWAQHRPNAEFELYERFNNLVYQALISPRERHP